MYKALFFCIVFFIAVQTAYSSVLGRWLADATPIGQFVKVVRDKVEDFANPQRISFDKTTSLDSVGTAQNAVANGSVKSSVLATSQDVAAKVSEDTAGEASKTNEELVTPALENEDEVHAQTTEANISKGLPASPDGRAQQRPVATTKTTTDPLPKTTSRPPKKVLPKPEPKPDLLQFTVNTQLPDARIRIMNIAPKYHDGIELPPGKYEVRVDREGYREEMHLIELTGLESNDSGVRTLNVSLQPLGLPECEENLKLENYAAGVQVFADGGHVLQTKAVFPNTEIFDLYNSYSQFLDSRGYFKVYGSVILPTYFEFHIAAPTNLSQKDFENNRSKTIDMERFVMYRTIFEKRGSDTYFVQQIFMPLGVEILEASKESICEHYMVF